MKKLLLLILLLFSFDVQAANRFAVCTTTCTWDASSTAMWSTTSGGGTGASVPGSSDAVILDAATCVGGTTCTITVNTTVTVQSITMGACTASTTGCILDFSANDNNVTLSVQFASSGTGTRTLNMGDGTWTLTNTTGSVWDCTTATNFTLNGNGSTILLSATATSQRTLALNNFTTYNNITVTNAAANQRNINFTGSPTIVNLTLTNTRNVNLTAATTITISGALTFNGTSATIPSILSTTSGTAATINVANATVLDSLVISGITKAGAGSITANNSYDIGNNTGITINSPSTGGGRIIGG